MKFNDQNSSHRSIVRVGVGNAVYQRCLPLPKEFVGKGDATMTKFRIVLAIAGFIVGFML
jgi:hypothetical protein